MADGGTPRDRALFGPGPKRILAIDGGGVRGVVALAFLEAIEAGLDRERGRETRLCEHFHLIGGTSTGAIVATALALGMRTADVRKLYFELAPRVFRARRMRVPIFGAKFDAESLKSEIERVVGARTLDTPDLLTGLAITLKRLDTGSAWILANNPRSKYWEDPADGAYLGNRRYPLASVVRASTAAPTYFDPQRIEIVAGSPPGLFVDGGLTPHNDPALALFLYAALPPYGLGWKTGEDALSIVSVGTGTFRPRLDAGAFDARNAANVALHSLTQQISESQALTLTLMSWLGAASTSWPVNSELGDLGGVAPPFPPLFRYARFDVKLETDWLRDALGERLGEADVQKLRAMDEPDNLDELRRLALKAAAIQSRGRAWS